MDDQIGRQVSNCTVFDVDVDLEGDIEPAVLAMAGGIVAGLVNAMEAAGADVDEDAVSLRSMRAHAEACMTKASGV